MELGNPEGADPGGWFAERLHAVVSDGLVTLHLGGVPWIRRPALPEDELLWRRRGACLLGAFTDQDVPPSDAVNGQAGDALTRFETAYWEGRGAIAQIRLGKR